MRRALPFVIVILALAGMADSAYLTVSYLQTTARRNAGRNRHCPLDVDCEVVERTTEATVLGIPTSLLGTAYFGFVLAAATMRLRGGSWGPAPFIEVVLSIGLFFSGYLVWVLLFEIGIPCPFCLFAHSVNAAIVLSYAISRRLDQAAPFRPRRWLLGHR